MRTGSIQDTSPTVFYDWRGLRKQNLALKQPYFAGLLEVAGALCFLPLWFFLVFFVLVAVVLLSVFVVAAGAANIRGMVPTARAIASKLFFMFFLFSLRAFARLQFHLAAEPLETR
ncbi:MAG TPA: hypothetical protein VG675_15465 [Bryobacteraceae bacterium]|nr:hypothetical protein [Bryobacteraceae bacterium]